MDESTLRLPDGRQLAYNVFGSPDGLPVFFFHGLAQSRSTVHPNIAILRGLGIRIVTIDRPGTGSSSPLPRRTLLEWPRDVLALADHLGLSRFALLGHSAGAPYVLACAYAIPDRVISATIISAVPPPSIQLLKSIFTSKFWKVGLLLFLAPMLIRPVISAGIRYRKPRAAILFERDIAALPGADRAVLADVAIKEMRNVSMLEALRQGSEGLYEDVVLLRRNWGFNLSDISVPISLWHGESDNIVAVNFGRELARRLPESATFNFYPNLGHYMIFSHWENILRSITEAVDVNRLTERKIQ